jgi:hypothetical protein
MTQAVAHIIDEVEHLSVPERIELRRLIAQRVPMTDDLTEEDFGVIAAESFRALDAEEDRPHA